MGNRIENRAILGTLRYKSAPETNLLFNVPLIQNLKQNTEFDRTLDIGLEQIFDDERQNSEIFKPSCKFTLLFKNSYSGVTGYEPFENNLYYVNSQNNAVENCSQTSNVFWQGLPQYNEFDFIRTDYDVTGYTQPPNQHLIFIPKSATNYNWMFYLTYPYSNITNKTMSFYDKTTNQTVLWQSGDGIPFVIFNPIVNGLGYIRFRCPVKHGLSTGEFVKLSFNYNGTDLFQVDSLGDETDGNDEYIFNITNVGYTGNTFNNGVSGTFKRVILRDNQLDTISKYYVRRHKIITDLSNDVLVKCGFEQNIFGTNKKFESRVYTPNKNQRISIKEGSQSYTLSFNQDININSLIDNQKRPVSELDFTVIWRGYFGWTNGASKQGWDFNLPLVNQQVSSWWSSPFSNTGFQIDSYNTTFTSPFKYTKSLNSGDTLDGDFCEWNDYEQTERVISDLYHKFNFNEQTFTISSNVNDRKFGYYYKAHYPLKIRDYSPYIEEGDITKVVGIPNYAYFSTTKNLFIWRDLYPYGYIDNDGFGVNYPFLNGSHYPFGNYVFRIIPEGTNYRESNIINSPTIDNCE